MKAASKAAMKACEKVSSPVEELAYDLVDGMALEKDAKMVEELACAMAVW